MKPTPHFIQMIGSLFQKQQKIISIGDLTRHNTVAITFYSISEGKFINNQLISKTDAFSAQIMIEVERGANKTIVGTSISAAIYSRTSPIEFGHTDGRGFIYWQAIDERNNRFYIVKLLANDGTLQIKIMSADQQHMTIHNVCELPQT